MAWLVFTLAIAAALLIGIERLIRRLGVERTDPSDAPRGVDLLVDQLRTWWRAR
ncbi:MAG TPA: hypothetical protein VMU89_14125 [Thermomicrobiaceae bacterium]|nr:hypothetical protein [Thermomicrobiaceae bacterium]